MPLAISTYASVDQLTDDPGRLNLAWTGDERQVLDCDLMAVIRDELAAEIDEGLPWLQTYPVKDPYGTDTFGPAVANYFTTPRITASVVCGAGVGPLLHGLSSLTRHRPVLVAGDIYPDLPHWAARWGSRCLAAGENNSVTTCARAARHHNVALVALERPDIRGARYDDLAELAQLCCALAPLNVIVLVDESNANYHPPAFSAVRLIEDVTNLIVVRGLSKAYGLGGLRLGYAVSSAALCGLVQGALPPLQCSSVSLRIGREVLALGDITTALRHKIDLHKTEFMAMLTAAGMKMVVASGENLPYVLSAESPDECLAALAERGVVGKLHALFSSTQGRVVHIARFSTPLNSLRMDTLRERMR